ncbi:MAG TPA: class I SAM-dependent methyltransferase [Candidatus Limnocylindrales bacterium]|nr:class I SAM-dependent methyltransferase [Candidatus Limnocylindrales bacterium]
MADEQELPEHVRRNRAYWDAQAAEYAGPGERNWSASEPSWGIWDIPEHEVRLLPDELAGRDVIELGCGTAYVSAWLARCGARVTGIDNSPAQRETARRLQLQHGLEFPLLLGNAEEVPLPDASFDLAISDYGAALWADAGQRLPGDGPRRAASAGWCSGHQQPGDPGLGQELALGGSLESAQAGQSGG